MATHHHHHYASTHYHHHHHHASSRRLSSLPTGPVTKENRGKFLASTILVAALIIAVVTYGICRAGLVLGKRFGTRLAGRASILGGLILIAIGIEVFLKNL